jgi:hypothetical protein
MKLAPGIALAALLVALPAAGKDKGAGRAAAPKSEELGLWETTTVKRSRQESLPREEWDAAGMSAFLFGRPMKTVTCSHHPVWIVFFDCEKQVAAGSGNCRVSENRDMGGVATERKETVITGDFRTRFHVNEAMTLEYKEDRKKWTDEVTSDHRYLGACKPGMPRHTTFHVKDNGEWVTEAQLKQELDARAQEIELKRKQ